MNIHYLHPLLLDSAHPITISLIGAGGTGSNLLTQLGRINHSLKALGHQGLHVTLYDPDTVSPSNLGRQLFSPTDIGKSKSDLLIHRINAFFGTSWQSVTEFYGTSDHQHTSNITLTAVDTVSARFEIAQLLQKRAKSPDHSPNKPYYWIDCGNTQQSGQVILSTVSPITQPKDSSYQCHAALPSILSLYPNIKEHESEELQGPSCSMAEALSKQDLFINSMIAQAAAKLLWNLLKEGFTIHQGTFINLDTMKMSPLKINQTH